MTRFYEHVMRESTIINQILDVDKDMIKLTNEQQAKYDAAMHCSVCHKPFSDSNGKCVITAMLVASSSLWLVTTAICS